MAASKKFYRLNQQITSLQVRLIDDKGHQIGVVSKDEALKKAREIGVDVVEVASNANPPVAKLIDFKKFLYQEEKKKREERKKVHIPETKEIRLGPFTSEHDLNVRIERAKEFLRQRDKIKIVIKFTGRQMAHPSFGQKTLQSFLDSIFGISKVEREPHFEGRFFWALVSPMKVREKSEAKDKKINSKTV